MEKLLTIFTPTYNRENTLPRLYDSLCKQTSNAFKWIIVDDGSTDNTEEIIKQWKLEDKITILYYRQRNMGKAMAHNQGVKLTDTELFVCVDSDDYLVTKAVESIINIWRKIRDKDFVGILALKGKNSTEEITKGYEKIKSATLRDAYRKYGLVGDTMLIYRTKIISKYSFPYFEGEKFVPEAYLYDLIDQNGELYFLPKVLYLVEYLNNGYTNNIRKTIKNNPNGYIAYINQRIGFDTYIVDKLQDVMRYISVARCKWRKLRLIVKNSASPFWTIILYPLGLFFFNKHYKKI